MHNKVHIAGRSLSKLLDLMSICEWSSKKKIVMPTVYQLTIPNNQGGKARWKSISNMTLNCKKNRIRKSLDYK